MKNNLEEKMLKQIFEEGLAIQKTRLRELRSQAQGRILVTKYCFNK